MPTSRNGKVKPAEIAADTKRNFIPHVKTDLAGLFPPYSILYRFPLQQLKLSPRTISSTDPPRFRVEVGDPVSRAIDYGYSDTKASEALGGPRVRVPFLCAANERRPGGDWETGCSGYEEKLCRRSNLSATLSSPLPGTGESSNYPIPSKGGILSDAVVVCRGPHDRYEKLNHLFDLPVISVPPTRWPKLKDGGSKYSFAEERELIREKIKAALRIALGNGYDRVVIGDFGLGNGHRNPPRELAEIWRDIFLFEPEVRGRFSYVVFVFEDEYQSTTALILDEMAKKEIKATPTGRHRRNESTLAVLARSHMNAPTDVAIFERIFHVDEINRLLKKPDPRYSLNMITT
jgi:uncharacterized protein (TIGR02452 family)